MSSLFIEQSSSGGGNEYIVGATELNETLHFLLKR